MGMRCDWRCPHCATTTEPVSGGHDRGFHAATQTRLCLTCKTVQDLEIGVMSDPSHRIFTPEESRARANPDPVCGTCSGRTVPWDRSCPSCGTPMERGEHMEFWD